MHIALGADHAGFHLKDSLKRTLDELGATYQDFGTASAESVDYPDFAQAVAHGVASGQCDRGILVCGTGIGMCIAANKVDGIRAALASDELSAQLSRSHNDANVLCLSADLIGPILAKRIVDVWMSTSFEGGRHERRLAKITRIEHGENPSA